MKSHRFKLISSIVIVLGLFVVMAIWLTTGFIKSTSEIVPDEVVDEIVNEEVAVVLEDSKIEANDIDEGQFMAMLEDDSFSKV